MSDIVWISYALANAAHKKPIDSSIYLDRKDNMNVNFRNLSGEALPEDMMPKYAVWKKSPTAKRNFPPFMYGDMPFVTKDFVDIASRFQLGGIRFIEVPVYASRTSDEPYGTIYFVNFANVVARFVPSKSENLSPAGSPEKPRWLAQLPADENQLAVSQLDRSGTDMWIDKHIHRAVFISNRLKQAFDEAKLSKSLDLLACKMVPDDPAAIDYSAELLKQKQDEALRIQRLRAEVEARRGTK